MKEVKMQLPCLQQCGPNSDACFSSVSQSLFLLIPCSFFPLFCSPWWDLWSDGLSISFRRNPCHTIIKIFTLTCLINTKLTFSYVTFMLCLFYNELWMLPRLQRAADGKQKFFITSGPVCQRAGVFGFIIWANTCDSGRQLLKQLQRVQLA